MSYFMKAAAKAAAKPMMQKLCGVIKKSLEMYTVKNCNGLKLTKIDVMCMVDAALGDMNADVLQIDCVQKIIAKASNCIDAAQKANLMQAIKLTLKQVRQTYPVIKSIMGDEVSPQSVKTMIRDNCTHFK